MKKYAYICNDEMFDVVVVDEWFYLKCNGECPHRFEASR